MADVNPSSDDTPPMPVIVAHRAGNTPEAAAAALELAPTCTIELDVHVLRGRVEVRHEKVLWPTRRLWERWYLLTRDSAGVPIEDVLAVTGPDVPLMVDLKCFGRRAARRVAAAVPAATDVIVSTRSWWLLPLFARQGASRRLRSCGNRLQLGLVGLLPGLGPGVGVALHERFATPTVIARLRARTDLVFCWGATTTERCSELVAAGVSGLILDDVRIARG